MSRKIYKRKIYDISLINPKSRVEKDMRKNAE